MLFRWLTLCLCCGCLGLLEAQDLHFSQFYHHPMHYSPALTGAFEGEVRAMGLARSQWTSVPVSYQSLALGADRKVWARGAQALSAGLVLQGDRAGDAGLSWVQLGLSVSAAQRLGERQYVAVGFSAALAQRQFDISRLKFGKQWTGDTFDPTLPSGESFDQTTGLRPTLGAGASWRTHSADYRSGAEVGLGAFHLNRPAIHFRDAANAQTLPVRWAASLQATQRMSTQVDAVVVGGFWQMGTAREVLAGGGARLWLKPQETALRFTATLRMGDAIIPALQYEFGDWVVGASYDWNISDFQVATRNRGGFELAVVYRPVPAPPLKTFKSCPVF
ncbi:MAG: PorP/SprF family type IX secretion system membrane protein [Saprospiraceae bacterium]|nr:PorP/SprF family type IX secretion system membrane protein [Saprospiraceae bacterium]MDW8230749.1 PorP/SprF family type IX secretion system membrane protein [Saprospiraceae bacterium]